MMVEKALQAVAFNHQYLLGSLQCIATWRCVIDALQCNLRSINTVVFVA